MKAGLTLPPRRGNAGGFTRGGLRPKEPGAGCAAATAAVGGAGVCTRESDEVVDAVVEQAEHVRRRVMDLYVEVGGVHDAARPPPPPPPAPAPDHHVRRITAQVLGWHTGK